MDRTSVRQDAASGNIRKTPYRNQIDYILTVNSFKGIQILDARSYGGMTTRSDHKLLLMKYSFQWSMNKSKRQHSDKIDYDKLQIPEIKEKYKKEVEKLLTPSINIAGTNESEKMG